jgi:hypothetical protein
MCPGTQASHLKTSSSKVSHINIPVEGKGSQTAQLDAFQHQAGPRCHRAGPAGSGSRHHPSNDGLFVLRNAVSLASAAGLNDISTDPSLSVHGTFVRGTDGSASEGHGLQMPISSGPVSYIQMYSRETASYYRKGPDILVRWTCSDCVRRVS